MPTPLLKFLPAGHALRAHPAGPKTLSFCVCVCVHPQISRALRYVIVSYYATIATSAVEALEALRRSPFVKEVSSLSLA